MKTINRVSRWPSAFVVASGIFTPIDQQMPLIYAEPTGASWPTPEDGAWTGCAETQELLSDQQFMKNFNAGLKELDSGQGISWNDLQKELDA